MRASLYDPSLGRFISRDPFGGFIPHPLTLNGYIYVQNDPGLLTDPLGFFSFGDFLQGAKNLGKEFIKQVGEDIVTAGIKGGQFAYNKFHDAGVILSGAEGGIAGRLGGWNILKPLGGALGDVISGKILNYVFSNGGKTAVSDVPFYSELPFHIGLFFQSAPVAGEMINKNGNVYDSQGNLLGKMGPNPGTSPPPVPMPETVAPPKKIVP